MVALLIAAGTSLLTLERHSILRRCNSARRELSSDGMGGAGDGVEFVFHRRGGADRRYDNASRRGTYACHCAIGVAAISFVLPGQLL
jgi:hypothetical protein